MKRKSILIIIFVLIILGYVLITYQQINHSNKVSISNLEIRSTSGCYVHIDIENKSEKFKVVCPNEFLYQGLRKEKWMPFHIIYVYKVGQKIKRNHSITLSNNIFRLFSDFIVNEDLLNEFKNKKILNDTTFVKEGYLNYKLNWEQKKAIIYELLSKDVNCCFTSEGGMNSIYLPSLTNEKKHAPPSSP